MIIRAKGMNILNKSFNLDKAPSKYNKIKINTMKVAK